MRSCERTRGVHEDLESSRENPPIDVAAGVGWIAPAPIDLQQDPTWYPVPVLYELPEMQVSYRYPWIAKGKYRVPEPVPELRVHCNEPLTDPIYYLLRVFLRSTSCGGTVNK